MHRRELEKMEAERLVATIRKEAKLTAKESRYLTVKLNSPVYDFNTLPPELMKKLRQACKRLNLTHKGERL